MGLTRPHRAFPVIPLLLVMAVPCFSAFGKVIYVDGDATGANDGTNWANAYVYLQDALSDANESPKPVEIHVAQGVYKPDQGANQTPGDREATFQLINGVTLKGGYASLGEIDPNARDVDAYETILSGDLNGNDLPVADPCDLPHDERTRNENSCHVVTGSGTDRTAVLDGFTMTGGNADGSDQRYEGGGMYNSSGSPTLTDCTFSGNSASRGGGVSNWENSNPTLTNCTFLRNWAMDGAAIQNIASSPMLTNCRFIENSAEWGGGMDNRNGNPKLVDCTFSRNWAKRMGGGMYNSGLSSPTLTNCTFNDNSTDQWGGGMVNWGFNAPTLTDCTFSRNCALSWGGGFYNHYSSPVLENCTVSENSACGGAGMFNESSNLTLTNCAFSGNSTPDDGGGMGSAGCMRLDGGGMKNVDSSLVLTHCTFTANSASYGGGMASSSEFFGEVRLTLTNCTFTGNLAVGGLGSSMGGGMYCSTHLGREAELTMTNCTFMGNLAVGEHGRGGGMHSSFDSPTLTNCLFSANSATASGGAIYNEGGRPQVSNCRFSGNSAGSAGGGWYNLGWGLDGEFVGPMVTHCTFSGNLSRFGGAIFNEYSSRVDLIKCILWGNTADYGAQVCLAGRTSALVMDYSDLEGGRTAIPFADDAIVWGPGNIDVDPGFAEAGYWILPTARQPGEPVWIEGDYHLKSEAGRWDPASEGWVIDDVTSPCIDGGDPNSPVAWEPFPNGGIVNMGAYGGTAEASKSPSGLHAQYGGGTGEPNDPYLIYTAEQMNAIGVEPNDWDKHFKLMADIDLDPNLPGRKAFDAAIIGDFAGVFDGNGHTVSHMTIRGADFLGLFGTLGSEATVLDLGLEALDVNGTGHHVGGLAGANNGNITASYSTGTIVGDGLCVGGLVGWNLGEITQCSSVCLVTGVNVVGGLLGANEHGGQVSDCYSGGTITGESSTGGLVGQRRIRQNPTTPAGWIINSYSFAAVNCEHGGGLSGLGAVTNCFWDIESSGKATSAGGTGLSTAEMRTAGTFLEAGWDFVGETENGTNDIWWIDEGQDYPRLWWERGEDETAESVEN